MPMTPSGRATAPPLTDPHPYLPDLEAYSDPRHVPGVTTPSTAHRRPESVGLYEEVAK